MALSIPLMFFAIPIIAILTNHQRKMAELIHSGQNKEASNTEIAALRHDIAELRALVHQQSIAIDNLADRTAASTDRIQDRIQI